MNSHRKGLTINQATFVVLLCFVTESIYAEIVSHKYDPDAIYVVTHASNTQNKLSQTGLNAIYNMRLRHWSDKSPISVYVLPDNDSIHRNFCKQKLHVFPHQIRKGWNKLVYSGSGQAPQVLENQEEMLKSVSKNPGAIGYVTGKDINSAVKVLEIE